MLLVGSVASWFGGGSLRSGALKLAVSGVRLVGRGQAAGRWSLMSPAQVVVCWICWPSSFTDASALSVGARWLRLRWGRCLFVVVDEVEEPGGLVLVPDQGAVEEFVAAGAYRSLGERVGLWRPGWRLDRVGADGGEHVVEGSGVLAGAVADHEPDRPLVGRGEVAGGLGGPGSGWVGRDSGEVHPSGVDLDEEQDVEAVQGDGVDAEEVGRDCGVGLAVNELAPGWFGAVGCGFASCVSDDLPDGGGGDALSKLEEFAVDVPVAPGRVVGVEADHEAAELAWCGRSAGSGLWWLGPVVGDQASVPADHSGGLDDQHGAVEPPTVEGTRNHREDRPVSGCESWSLNLSLEDEDLMAEGEDLGVMSVAGHKQQPEASNR